jgi:hypothetical protein
MTQNQTIGGAPLRRWNTQGRRPITSRRWLCSTNERPTTLFPNTHCSPGCRALIPTSSFPGWITQPSLVRLNGMPRLPRWSVDRCWRTRELVDDMTDALFERVQQLLDRFQGHLPDLLIGRTVGTWRRAPGLPAGLAAAPRRPPPRAAEAAAHRSARRVRSRLLMMRPGRFGYQRRHQLNASARDGA